ncbi:hypothetical protein QJQ45_004315 [Haematococcus lacustris]|nr:hypothetical protein QJQ45_004315 [Haematococcus lacustris]
MKPPTGAMECSWPDECAASPNGLPGGWPPTCDVFLGFADTPSDCYKQPGPSAAPLKAMGSKKRAVKAKCANMQKAREVVAQRRAAEAAGPREVEAQAKAIAAEAEAQANAGADEADAQLHQLQADPQHRELQRKEQQLADLESQQRAALLQWEQQLIELQHQLEQQQADLSRREQDLTERQHQLQQQQADLDSREQQQARIQTLPQQLHSLQQELKAQQVAEVQRVVQQQLALAPLAAAAGRPATDATTGGEAAFGLFAGYQQQPPPPRPFSMLSRKVAKPTSRASYCGPRIVQPNPASAKQPFLPATTTSAWGHSH